MPKKDAFGYDMKHTKMDDLSREDSSPHNDLRGYISLVSNLYWLKSLAKAILRCQYRSCGTNMNRVWK